MRPSFSSFGLPFPRSAFLFLVLPHLFTRMTPSIRAPSSLGPSFPASESPFLSREWKEGLLERPERPHRPVPAFSAAENVDVGSWNEIRTPYEERAPNGEGWAPREESWAPKVFPFSGTGERKEMTIFLQIDRWTLDDRFNLNSYILVS